MKCRLEIVNVQIKLAVENTISFVLRFDYGAYHIYKYTSISILEVSGFSKNNIPCDVGICIEDNAGETYKAFIFFKLNQWLYFKEFSN